MSLPLIPTKLQLPSPRSGLVLRPRLVQKLNAGLDGKLTLISASTGFGKTTLASAWIKHCGRPAAWLALDELDNDPLRFLTYLIRAIQTVQPGFGADLLETLGTANPQDFEPVPVPILEALTAEIAAIQTHFLLALDDYHLINRPAIQAIPQFLLKHQPANLHLVLVSRADPPWPLGRLRARREMSEIRAADLRFSPQEAAEFLNACMGLGLTPERVTAKQSPGLRGDCFARRTLARNDSRVWLRLEAALRIPEPIPARPLKGKYTCPTFAQFHQKKPLARLKTFMQNSSKRLAIFPITTNCSACGPKSVWPGGTCKVSSAQRCACGVLNWSHSQRHWPSNAITDCWPTERCSAKIFSAQNS